MYSSDRLTLSPVNFSESNLKEKHRDLKPCQTPKDPYSCRHTHIPDGDDSVSEAATDLKEGAQQVS